MSKIQQFTKIGDAYFQCNKCDKVIRNYVDHYNSCNGLVWICPHCEKHYARKAAYTRHVLSVHFGQAAYTCNKCNDTFHSLKDLKKHKEKYIHIE